MIDDGHGGGDLLNLIVEVSGEPKKDKVQRLALQRRCGFPRSTITVGFDGWDFIEIRDPWDARSPIRAALEANR